MAVAAHKIHYAKSDLAKWKNVASRLYEILEVLTDVPVPDMELITTE